MKIFVYGSLKRGCYNHKRCELDKAKFIGESKVIGYKLYSLGSYPCIVPSNDDSVVFGEIYEVNDEIFNRIRNMELGAGYIEVEYTEGDMKFILWAKESMKDSYHRGLVESGVWVEV